MYRTDKCFGQKLFIYFDRRKFIRILSSFDAEMSESKIYPVRVGNSLKWPAKPYLLKILKCPEGLAEMSKNLKLIVRHRIDPKHLSVR
jgi:hypothetical protein